MLRQKFPHSGPHVATTYSLLPSVRAEESFFSAKEGPFFRRATAERSYSHAVGKGGSHAERLKMGEAE